MAFASLFRSRRTFRSDVARSWFNCSTSFNILSGFFSAMTLVQRVRNFSFSFPFLINFPRRTGHSVPPLRHSRLFTQPRAMNPVYKHLVREGKRGATVGRGKRPGAAAHGPTDHLHSLAQ